MSKLDRKFEVTKVSVEEDHLYAYLTPESKRQVKAFVLELIGEDERLDDSDAEANQIRNVFRHELKAKVNES